STQFAVVLVFAPPAKVSECPVHSESRPLTTTASPTASGPVAVFGTVVPVAWVKRYSARSPSLGAAVALGASAPMLPRTSRRGQRSRTSFASARAEAGAAFGVRGPARTGAPEDSAWA